VGDSLRTVGTFEALNALAVEVCTNVTAAPAVLLDAERYAYRQLHCAKCTAPLGKAYLRAPPHLQALVGAITFDVDSLQSYPLGTASNTASLLPVATPSATLNNDAAGEGGETAVGWSVEEELRAELLKVQAIILSMNERVTAIEARHAEEVGDAALPTNSANSVSGTAAPAAKKRK
jgi:hypothetical protein